MALQTCNVARARYARPPEAVFSDDPGEYRGVCHTAVLLACLGALAASFVLRPHEQGLSLLGYRWPFSCWLHETFGLKCALCGMSRAFCSLAHGDIASGLRFHPLGPAVLLLFCLEVPYRLYALLRLPRPLPVIVRKTHFGSVGLVAVAIFANWLLYLGGLIL